MKFRSYVGANPRLDFLCESSVSIFGRSKEQVAKFTIGVDVGARGELRCEDGRQRLSGSELTSELDRLSQYLNVAGTVANRQRRDSRR
jgi:hypothetical protein